MKVVSIRCHYLLFLLCITVTDDGRVEKQLMKKNPLYKAGKVQNCGDVDQLGCDFFNFYLIGLDLIFCRYNLTVNGISNVTVFKWNKNLVLWWWKTWRKALLAVPVGE